MPIRPASDRLVHGDHGVQLGARLGFRGWYREAREQGWSRWAAFWGAVRNG